MITELQDIEADVVAMSAKLPASLGQKANASSLSICRSSTTGAFDLSGRTTIATASTSTKLLCDADGHLQVDIVSGAGGVSNGSETTYVSGQLISSAGTFTGSSISVPASTKAIFIEHNFTDANISFNVEQSIDGSSFFPTSLTFNTVGTTTGINVLTNTYSTTPSAVGFSPHIRFLFTNGAGSDQTITSLSYVIQS